MVNIAPAPATVIVSSRTAEPAGVALDAGSFAASSYVEWPSVFVGTVVALAVAFVLLTFGAAVGLTAVSPWTSARGSIVAVSIGAAFWMILVHIWAFGLGGYLAGRMRHRRSGALPMEVEFRDGTHGVAVWGLAVTSGAIVAALVAASVARGGLEAGASAARSYDPTSIATDLLLRTSRPATDARGDDVRGEMSRLLLRSSGRAAVSAVDRTYLAELVATRTGLTPTDAAKRVDDTIVQLKDATNRARKMAVVLGFITAATLLLGAAAAWWGATVGGRHRDENTIWAGFANHALDSSLWTKL
jgi:hypothetical protein